MGWKIIILHDKPMLGHTYLALGVRESGGLMPLLDTGRHVYGDEACIGMGVLCSWHTLALVLEWPLRMRISFG